jgi:hypothetical protein
VERLDVTAIAGDIEPVDGVTDLAATFTAAGLPVPPIPAGLGPALIRRDEWLWATREVDRLEMYIFGRYPGEILKAPVADYLAISHAGHGVNSYSINYHLVWGPLALFTQIAWGGVYMDNAEAVAEMTAQFAGIAALLPLAEARAATWDGTRRLLVLQSTFRFAAACQWFRPGDASSMRFQEPVGVPAPVLELAVRELEGCPGAGRA